MRGAVAEGVVVVPLLRGRHVDRVGRFGVREGHLRGRLRIKRHLRAGALLRCAGAHRVGTRILVAVRRLGVVVGLGNRVGHRTAIGRPHGQLIAVRPALRPAGRIGNGDGFRRLVTQVDVLVVGQRKIDGIGPLVVLVVGVVEGLGHVQLTEYERVGELGGLGGCIHLRCKGVGAHRAGQLAVDRRRLRRCRNRRAVGQGVARLDRAVDVVRPRLRVLGGQIVERDGRPGAIGRLLQVVGFLRQVGPGRAAIAGALEREAHRGDARVHAEVIGPALRNGERGVGHRVGCGERMAGVAARVRAHRGRLVARGLHLGHRVGDLLAHLARLVDGKVVPRGGSRAVGYDGHRAGQVGEPVHLQIGCGKLCAIDRRMQRVGHRSGAVAVVVVVLPGLRNRNRRGLRRAGIDERGGRGGVGSIGVGGQLHRCRRACRVAQAVIELLLAHRVRDLGARRVEDRQVGPARRALVLRAVGRHGDLVVVHRGQGEALAAGRGERERGLRRSHIVAVVIVVPFLRRMHRACDERVGDRRLCRCIACRCSRLRAVGEGARRARRGIGRRRVRRANGRGALAGRKRVAHLDRAVFPRVARGAVDLGQVVPGMGPAFPCREVIGSRRHIGPGAGRSRAVLQLDRHVVDIVVQVPGIVARPGLGYRKARGDELIREGHRAVGACLDHSRRVRVVGILHAVGRGIGRGAHRVGLGRGTRAVGVGIFHRAVAVGGTARVARRQVVHRLRSERAVDTLGERDGRRARSVAARARGPAMGHVFPGGIVGSRGVFQMEGHAVGTREVGVVGIGPVLGDRDAGRLQGVGRGHRGGLVLHRTRRGAGDHVGIRMRSPVVGGEAGQRARVGIIDCREGAVAIHVAFDHAVLVGNLFGRRIARMPVERQAGPTGYTRTRLLPAAVFLVQPEIEGHRAVGGNRIGRGDRRERRACRRSGDFPIAAGRQVEHVEVAVGSAVSVDRVDGLPIALAAHAFKLVLQLQGQLVAGFGELLGIGREQGRRIGAAQLVPVVGPGLGRRDREGVPRRVHVDEERLRARRAQDVGRRSARHRVGGRVSGVVVLEGLHVVVRRRRSKRFGNRVARCGRRVVFPHGDDQTALPHIGRGDGLVVARRLPIGAVAARVGDRPIACGVGIRR